MGDPEVKAAHVTAIRREHLKVAEAHSVGSVVKEAEKSARLWVGEGTLVKAPMVQRPGLTNPLCFLGENNSPIIGSGMDQVGQ